MLNIAFCDDDQEILNQLQNLLDQYRKDKMCQSNAWHFRVRWSCLPRLKQGCVLTFCFWMLLCPVRMESMWQEKSGSMMRL